MENKLDIVFWQNIISPHQMDLLSELAKTNKVTLVVEQEIDEQRKSQAWSTMVDENITLIVNPNLIAIIKLIKSKKSAVHLFSGFFSYKLMSLALCVAAFFRLPIYIISEAVESDTFKGKLKLKIRSAFACFFKGRMKGVFVTGQRALEYFIKLGFSKDKIVEYGYFVDVQPKNYFMTERTTTNIIFVGRLIPCKGINKLLQSFSLLTKIDSSYKLRIIGSGPLEKQLKEEAVNIGLSESTVTFMKDMPRNEVLAKIEQSDLLVLPNVGEEGWGVVVNESLLLGTPVICSQFTGANVVINPNMQGKVIDITNDELVDAILSMKQYDRKSVITEAQKRLLPSVVSKYLLDVITEKETTFTPWYK